MEVCPGALVNQARSCSEMKAGEVYGCMRCWLEVQVRTSCADGAEGECSCKEPLGLTALFGRALGTLAGSIGGTEYAIAAVKRVETADDSKDAKEKR